MQSGMLPLQPNLVQSLDDKANKWSLHSWKNDETLEFLGREQVPQL
jgi:hypothetical protein